jgi:hypothetical protein
MIQIALVEPIAAVRRFVTTINVLRELHHPVMMEMPVQMILVIIFHKPVHMNVTFPSLATSAVTILYVMASPFAVLPRELKLLLEINGLIAVMWESRYLSVSSTSLMR